MTELLATAAVSVCRETRQDELSLTVCDSRREDRRDESERDERS